MQNAVEWRMVVSRGQDERSQMLNTCEGMTNRVLIDDGAKWMVQGSGQEQRDRTDGVNSYAGVDNLWSCEGARETRAE